jgi:DNA-binding response OmpR family regulator
MKTILVIDDDDDVRETIIGMLKGYQALTAADGREGIQLCEIALPDLVLTDIVMPTKEGVETIIEMRKRWVDLPIIAMSGGWRQFSENYLKVALELGANRILTKPFKAAVLLATISELT